MEAEKKEGGIIPACVRTQNGADETDAVLLHSIPQLGNRQFESNLLYAFFCKRYFTVSTGMSAPCSTP